MSHVSECYGELTFSKEVMKAKLNKIVYTKLLAVIESGEPLDEKIADDVAHAMKEWAIDKGATHFTHWFQPQRGGTAEKHDAFITYDENGEIIERFSASQLIQSEPDASSFPSGGMRSTFEARGYTAWDPTSPAFLIEAGTSRTLVIPSVFLSWTGHVLDLKTPLLRSNKALDDASLVLQKLLGNRSVRRTKVFIGAEQEYFLFNKELHDTRKDLRICKRTLFGASPIKGQQMEDHYFGSIIPRVRNFMEDLDRALFRKGIPAKTRHNEVAPNQFEIAPLFSESNRAIDDNLKLMNIIKEIADTHGMTACLHEKPIAGVNGSGKHVNWSIGDNTGNNYLEPSKSPLKNISFLLTIGAILLGMKKFGGILRASVACAGNDHRLGANEAPPAIMSVYLGEYITALFNEIEGLETVTEKKLQHISLGVQNIPKISKDSSDRNRTSPLAFTGNKFEFRAVGSSQNVAESVTVLNLMCAYGYSEINKKLTGMKGEAKSNALVILKEILKQTKDVRFEGNNYSEDWHKEAARRGLPNNKNTPSAYEEFFKPGISEAFEHFGILSKEELHSKIEIKIETYNKIKAIEYKTAVSMVRTQILPAILQHITNTTQSLKGLTDSGISSAAIKDHLVQIESYYSGITSHALRLEQSVHNAEKEDSAHKQSLVFADACSCALEELRSLVDSAERLIPDNIWPYAKYQDLLLKL